MQSTFSHFTARYYASSVGLFAVVMCLSVCLSVRQSVTSRYSKKVKFSHTRYRALGPELIPVYRQSARR